MALDPLAVPPRLEPVPSHFRDRSAEFRDQRVERRSRGWNGLNVVERRQKRCGKALD